MQQDTILKERIYGKRPYDLWNIKSYVKSISDHRFFNLNSPNPKTTQQFLNKMHEKVQET